ncbi:MAG: radical SAM protein [archaeon]
MQAYIGGVLPLSTDHWINNICTVVSFSGCDFRCPYCDTPDLLEARQETLTNLKDVQRTIQENAAVINGVFLTGGEPCLQRQALVELCVFAKRKNLKVGIDTNGSKPEVLASILKQGLADYICLDAKAPIEEEIFNRVTCAGTFFKTSGSVAQDFARTLGLIRKYQDNVLLDVKTTVVPGLMYKKEDVLQIAEKVSALSCTWILKAFSSNKKVLNQKYQNINSPSQSFLDNLKGNCLRRYPDLPVRIEM